MARAPRKGGGSSAPRKAAARRAAASDDSGAQDNTPLPAPAPAPEPEPDPAPIATAPVPAPEKRGRGRPRKARPNGPLPEKIAEYLADLTSLKTTSARISQQIAALLARFENEGGDRKELKAMLVLSKLDRREAEAAVLRHITYAQALGFVKEEEDGQFSFASLFGGDAQGDGVAQTEAPAAPSKRTPRDPDGEKKLALAQAYSDGWNTGRHGGGKDNNPFNAGTETHVRWHEGLTDGLADKVASKPKSADRAALVEGMPTEGVADNPAMGLPH